MLALILVMNLRPEFSERYHRGEQWGKNVDTVSLAVLVYVHLREYANTQEEHTSRRAHYRFPVMRVSLSTAGSQQAKECSTAH